MMNACGLAVGRNAFATEGVRCRGPARVYQSVDKVESGTSDHNSHGQINDLRQQKVVLDTPRWWQPKTIKPQRCGQTDS